MSEAPKKRWYVVQAFSGFEGRVATSLREHIKLHNMEELFGEVMVPTEEVVEIRGGQRRKSERKFFPGYVLVQMVMNDASWHLVRSVPRVMGFIGGTSDRPAPISDKEVDAIMTACSRLAISRGRKLCLNRVKWFVLTTVRSQTLTALSKKSIMRSLA
ncbi:transcription antitermination protein [Salmonella enterica subsp. enterica serovar Typhimurium str. DT104]|nr:transcription antitermination protein [Salmonella enterica subsp. enterica serovar Typhimurium str. DT104]